MNLPNNTLRCRLFGCREDEHCYCQRCGVDIYDGFIQSGKLSPLVWGIKAAWYRVSSLVVGTKCDVCGKRYWRGWDNYTCSKECCDKWLPF